MSFCILNNRILLRLKHCRGYDEFSTVRFSLTRINYNSGSSAGHYQWENSLIYQRNTGITYMKDIGNVTRIIRNFSFSFPKATFRRNKILKHVRLHWVKM